MVVDGEADLLEQLTEREGKFRKDGGSLGGSELEIHTEEENLT